MPTTTPHPADEPTSAPPAGGMSWETLREAKTTLYFTGDIKDVLAGRVPDEAHVPIHASRFQYGFEAASVLGLDSLGEFVGLNGTAYTKLTGSDLETYYSLASGPIFVSTGGTYLGDEAAAAAHLSLGLSESPAAPPSFADVYALIDEHTRAPACFAGKVEFEALHGLAIGKAPVHGEAIMEHHQAYYPQGQHLDEGVFAFVMGCQANFAFIADRELRTGLGRVLYDNPFEEAANLSTHTHALFLSIYPDDLADIGPADAIDVRHVLAQSTLKRLELDIFVIGDVEPLP